MDIFTLVARLAMDTSDYDKKIATSKNSFMQLGSTISAKAVAFGQLTARAIEKAASAAVELGKSTIEAAADVEAEKAQFTATFGEMQGAAEKAFSNIEKSTGVFGTRLKNVGTKAFSQFKGAGLEGVDALTMMEEYTNLAADAAAYYDISLEDADARLRSFLRGNTEAGDAIGLFTSESQRNTAAMEKYGQKWLDLTEAQKQMLMLDIGKDIYEQSGAIGQASRESDAWTNVIGNLKEVWRQTKATFGAPIMAVITPKLQEFAEWLKGEGVQTKIEQFALGVADKINSFFNWVANPTFPTWEEIKTDAEAKIATINTALEGAINWALGKLGFPDAETVIADVQEWWTGQGANTYERIKSVLSWTLGKFVAPSLDAIGEWWNSDGGAEDTLWGMLTWTLGDIVFPAIGDVVSSAGQTVAAWAKGFIKGVVDLLDWKLGELNLPTVTEIAGKIQAWWNDVKSSISLTLTPVLNLFERNSSENTKTENEYLGEYAYGWNTGYETNSFGGGTSTGTGNGRGFATGLDYVPYNDFFARLHEGEAVLTKSEANAWRSGGNSQPIDYTAMGSAVGVAVREALEGIKLYTDDGTAIADLVTERVSRNIAREAQSKRFATV